MKRVNIYEKNFIKQVIARVDFESPLALELEGVLSGLPADLREEFSNIEERDLQTQQITLSFERSASAVSQSVGEPVKLWVMRSRSDPGRILELCSAYASLSSTSYTRFSEFTPPLYSLIDRVAALCPDGLAFRRVGLRYVDHVDVPGANPTEWAGLISPVLTGALQFGQERGFLRAMTTAEYLHEDAFVRVQFGMPNPDFPAKASRHLFVLDIDGFVASRTLLSELAPTLESLNHVQYDYFEEAIGPGLRDEMVVGSEEDRDD